MRAGYRLDSMPRSRNIRPWKQPNYAFNSIAEFKAEDRRQGLFTIRHNGDYLDFLVHDNNSPTTLVVFSGALSIKAKFTPAFSGIRLSQDTGVNLVAVADPSMSHGDITVAWYLGNDKTGPILSHLTDAIQHILDSLQTENTIIFGGSGGGYAAARFAYEFPGCTAFIFNPRLNLEKWSEGPLKRYFRFALNQHINWPPSPSQMQELEKFGPVRVSDLARGKRNHKLLIYQNLLDYNFLELQVLPYMRAINEDENVLYKFEIDDLGHNPIPGDKVRDIIKSLSNESPQREEYIQENFLSGKVSIDSLLLEIANNAKLKHESALKS